MNKLIIDATKNKIFLMIIINDSKHYMDLKIVHNQTDRKKFKMYRILCENDNGEYGLVNEYELKVPDKSVMTSYDILNNNDDENINDINNESELPYVDHMDQFKLPEGFERRRERCLISFLRLLSS